MTEVNVPNINNGGPWPLSSFVTLPTEVKFRDRVVPSLLEMTI